MEKTGIMILTSPLTGRGSGNAEQNKSIIHSLNISQNLIFHPLVTYYLTFSRVHKCTKEEGDCSDDIYVHSPTRAVILEGSIVWKVQMHQRPSNGTSKTIKQSIQYFQMLCQRPSNGSILSNGALDYHQ